MTFDEAANKLANRVRDGRQGFLTLRREELRDAFGIGKFTEGQAEQVCEALGRVGIIVYPHPYSGSATLRLYDAKGHLVGQVAEAVAFPNEIPESALRRANEVIARASAGRDLRSDDAPWLTAFDIFLQVVMGREPEEWEELNDERHPVVLARELGEALGLPKQVADDYPTFQVAAAVCAFRPRRRRWTARGLAGDLPEAAVLPLLDSLEQANRGLRDQHDNLLRQAARLLLRSDSIPTNQVELGVLGLRYRREDGHRSDPR